MVMTANTRLAIIKKIRVSIIVWPSFRLIDSQLRLSIFLNMESFR